MIAKLIYTSLIVCCFSFTLFSQTEVEIIYKNDLIKCVYENNLGRFDGKYVSYYNNGQKRAEGYFETNYRIGEWTVWDYTGNVKMKRVYENPFTFKQLYPELPKDELIDLLNSPRYVIEHNKEGFIERFDLKGRMVEWQKRIYRLLLPNENPLLFEENRLWNVLKEQVVKGNVVAYSDEGFENELDSLQLQNLSDSSIEAMGFKYKEDYIFDNDRFVMEAFPWVISPVIIDAKQDTSELFWVLMNDVLKYLGKTSVIDGELKSSEKIKTIDELFFYRDFYGEIYKESNIAGNAIKDYKKSEEIAKEAQRIEISIIESEHSNWIWLTQ